LIQDFFNMIDDEGWEIGSHEVPAVLAGLAGAPWENVTVDGKPSPVHPFPIDPAAITIRGVVEDAPDGIAEGECIGGFFECEESLILDDTPPDVRIAGLTAPFIAELRTGSGKTIRVGTSGVERIRQVVNHEGHVLYHVINGPAGAEWLVYDGVEADLVRERSSFRPTNRERK
jgi:hypothetical protein